MTPTISYAITACNEHEELERLLIQLHNHGQDGFFEAAEELGIFDLPQTSTEE
jgi:hypothetical protein